MADKKRISTKSGAPPRPGPGPSGTQRWEVGDDELTTPTVRELPPELAGIQDIIPRVPGTARASGGVEIQLVHDVQPAGRNKPWRAAEVWTKNRIYGMDSLMI